ncbi:MAG: PhoH family protein [Kiritimatiellia bacterium]|jgi:PhoH-like ATPase|nr:PhoH family protein [Kiritimatiellia bacterium]
MPVKSTARRSRKQSVKTFVLDTNVLLHSPNALNVFDDNHVVLPMAVLEELDKFKTQSSELGRNARETIRKLDALRAVGKLSRGVPLPGRGTLRVLVTPEIERAGLEDDTPDNALIRLAYSLVRQGERVIIVSMDLNVRVKANALDLETEDFEHDKVNFDELYCGYAEASVPRAVIERLYSGQVLTTAPTRCHPNMFLHLSAAEEPDMKVIARVFPDGTLAEINLSIDTVYGIQSRNIEQRMALELLMDPAVTLVTLVGQAGTGKTLLALAAGLHLVQRAHLFDRILVSRPIVPLGKDIGYLPGDKEEKLSHWMEPIFDNLDYLLRKTQPNQLPPGAKKQPKPQTPQDRINQLLDNDTLELEALTYIRGRSISRQFILIDEAQNLTPHEVKTVVSRAGEGSKIILTGDPYQIDNPYLDASSNGLTYAAERLKDLPLHGHVTLHQSERSQLAAAAAQYL